MFETDNEKFISNQVKAIVDSKLLLRLLQSMLQAINQWQRSAAYDVIVSAIGVQFAAIVYDDSQTVWCHLANTLET